MHRQPPQPCYIFSLVLFLFLVLCFLQLLHFYWNSPKYVFCDLSLCHLPRPDILTCTIWIDMCFCVFLQFFLSCFLFCFVRMSASVLTSPHMLMRCFFHHFHNTKTWSMTQLQVQEQDILFREWQDEKKHLSLSKHMSTQSWRSCGWPTGSACQSDL